MSFQDERSQFELEDCRLYVGGGCQENVLENTEINSRRMKPLHFVPSNDLP